MSPAPPASDTPETDELAHKQWGTWPKPGEIEAFDLARSLERRLREAEAEAKRCHSNWTRLQNATGEECLELAIPLVESWKEAAESKLAQAPSAEGEKEVERLRQQLSCNHDFEYNANAAGSQSFNRCRKCGLTKSAVS